MDGSRLYELRRAQVKAEDKGGNSRPTKTQLANNTYKGVYLRQCANDRCVWDVRIHIHKKHNPTADKPMFPCIGAFATPEEAAKAYDQAAIFFKGDQAQTNYPVTDYKDDELLRLVQFLDRDVPASTTVFLGMLREYYNKDAPTTNHATSTGGSEDDDVITCQQDDITPPDSSTHAGSTRKGKHGAFQAYRDAYRDGTMDHHDGDTPTQNANSGASAPLKRPKTGGGREGLQEEQEKALTTAQHNALAKTKSAHQKDSTKPQKAASKSNKAVSKAGGKAVAGGNAAHDQQGVFCMMKEDVVAEGVRIEITINGAEKTDSGIRAAIGGLIARCRASGATCIEAGWQCSSSCRLNIVAPAGVLDGWEVLCDAEAALGKSLEA